MGRETWVVMLGMAGFALSLFTYLRAMKRDLGIEIDKVDDRVSKLDDRVGEVDDRVERTRAELNGVIGQFRAEVGVRFATLEQRTFILAPQSPEKPTGS